MADFDPGLGTEFLTGTGDNNIFIVKLDNNGNLIWARNMSGIGRGEGYSIIVDKDGYVYTTGYFTSTIDFDPGEGTANLTGTGMSNVFVSKLDANGNYVWAKSMESTIYNYGNGILVDVNGNVYVTGEFAGIADFDPGEGIKSLTSVSLTDIFIFKLDGNGNLLWAKGIGDTGYDGGSALAFDSKENIYLTGYFGEVGGVS